MITESAACAAGTTGTTRGAFGTGLYELAEHPEASELGVDELVALEVLRGAVFVGRALGLTHAECAKILALTREATASADRGVGACRTVGQRAVEEPFVKAISNASALKRRVGARLRAGATDGGHRDDEGHPPTKNKHVRTLSRGNIRVIHKRARGSDPR